jgi:hypothetical protein
MVSILSTESPSPPGGERRMEDSGSWFPPEKEPVRECPRLNGASLSPNEDHGNAGQAS